MTLPWRLRHLECVELFGAEVRIAGTLRSRVLGLALLRRRRAGDGLLIPRCGSVHTYGMRFRLDLVFLDRGGRVVALKKGVPPGRVVSVREADAVLELAPGWCRDGE